MSDFERDSWQIEVVEEQAMLAQHLARGKEKKVFGEETIEMLGDVRKFLGVIKVILTILAALISWWAAKQIIPTITEEQHQKIGEYIQEEQKRNTVTVTTKSEDGETQDKSVELHFPREMMERVEDELAEKGYTINYGDEEEKQEK